MKKLKISLRFWAVTMDGGVYAIVRGVSTAPVIICDSVTGWRLREPIKIGQEREPEADPAEHFLDKIAMEIEERQSYEDAGLTASVHHSGGGIFGVLITSQDSGDYQIFWGTANENWGADVNNTEGDHIASIESDLPTSTVSPETIAREIERLTLRWLDEAHGRGA